MGALDLFKLRKDGFLKILGALLTITSISGFFHSVILYYVILGVFGLIVIYDLFTLGFVANYKIILFLAICVLSLVVNVTPKFFNAWSRLGVYVLVLFVVSPMMSNAAIDVKRRKLLIYVMDTCIILSVLSFFCYFLGINLFLRQDENLEIGVGTFSGLMNHSMVLGPVSGLSFVVLLSYFLCEDNSLKRIGYLAAALCCLGSCFLSASRIAVGAAIVGWVYVLYIKYRTRLTRFAIVILVVLAVGGVTFPIWGGITDFLVQKQQISMDLGGSIMSSRETKFNARIIEFKSKPICGIGFATVDPLLDKVNLSDGQIEPGSSWLAILSMTGLLGLITFLSICHNSYKILKFMDDVFYSCTLGGLFVYYLIHFIAEGYIMAPGSFLNMLFWLVLGSINVKSDNLFEQMRP